ncbi:MAG: VWA domain-containing protein [bacterium]|nr:VWA domain-containing protein [bacterium]
MSGDLWVRKIWAGSRSGRSSAICALAVILAAVMLASAPSQARSKKTDLKERYQRWLEDVELILLQKERKAFLALEKDYQRDAFIQRFWKSRDPDPETPDNRFKGQYLERLEEARERYKIGDERAEVFVLNGEPTSVEDTDCGLILWPLQIWRYSYSENTRGSLTLVFHERGWSGTYRLWHPNDGYDVLVQAVTTMSFGELVREKCIGSAEEVERLLVTLRSFEQTGEATIRSATSASNSDPEWLATFRAFSTDADSESKPLEAELFLDFPGLHQQRVIVRGSVRVPGETAQVVELAGRRSYNFSLIGEVLREDELFDSFKYLFDVPEVELVDGQLPLLFERWLRPGSYRLILKIEDLHGGAVGRIERQLDVPVLRSEGLVVAAGASAGEGADEGEERVHEASIVLVAEGKDLQRGYARFSASVEGTEIAKVRFFLEDRPVLTKTRPPYSVELDLGSLPETMSVRAVVLDAAGREIAADELLLNPGEYSFGVSLIEPRWGSRHTGSVEARVQVQTPQGSVLERVEFHRGDQKIATLFQEPFKTTIPLPHEDLVVVRAVAFLDDGNSTEDLAVLNGADYLENIDVRMVEVFASVLDGRGRPLADLERDQFRVLDNGEEQEILRFEHLEDLPIYAGLLIDTSASMAERMTQVRDAAVRFFEEAIRSQDRASVITFADRPRLAAGFTSDLFQLTGALAGIKAGQGTALYDSILFALYNFRGLKGQRALLVLSDGEDRRSKATFDEARAFALNSGVTVYTVGVEKGMSRRGKAELVRLAEETGGRAFLIDSVDELDAIYGTIQKDLRSKYFLAYQPAPSEDKAFRTVEVRVASPGAEVRALRGYVPR